MRKTVIKDQCIARSKTVSGSFSRVGFMQGNIGDVGKWKDKICPDSDFRIELKGAVCVTSRVVRGMDNMHIGCILHPSLTLASFSPKTLSLYSQRPCLFTTPE